MKTERLTVLIDQYVARVTITRPEVHNAFDAELILDLTRAFDALSKNDSVRVVVLSSVGKNFCAGADLHWMKSTVRYTKSQNEKDAMRMHKMLAAIYQLDKPTIARVQGIAFGGGVGLASAVDVVVASSNAQFALTEVRLGILPAVISPFVIRKMGLGAFRAYGLSAKKMSSDEALRLGLVQEVVLDAELDSAVERWVSFFRENAPGAMATLKGLSTRIAPLSVSAAAKFTTKAIANARAGDEGQEGIAAFFEKRSPGWKTS